jgi:hypothetical protein
MSIAMELVTEHGQRSGDRNVVASTPVAGTACRCGHDAEAHEHFRAGSDCGLCGRQGCGRFAAARRRFRWLR